MTKYRVKAYVSWDVNYYMVQEQVWWGWRTVAKNIKVADSAAQIVRDLLKAEKEFEEKKTDNPLNYSLRRWTFDD